MTCKDCIHSGVCYKENDYENFPDRCGEFISDRPQGEWIRIDDEKVKCPICEVIHLMYSYPRTTANFCPNCGADMRGKENGLL